MEEKKKASDFESSGISIIKISLEVKITENEMLRDLIEKTVGKNIPINNINDN